jgi:hypothetical protein
MIMNAIFFSWATLRSQAGGRLYETSAGKFMLSIAAFPSSVNESIKTVFNIHDASYPLLRPKNSFNQISWQNKFPAPDDGFLLLSTVDHTGNFPLVQLIRIQDGTVLHSWKMDFDSFNQKEKITDFHKNLSVSKATRLFHPTLLEDGSLIFIANGTLVKLSSKNEIIWTNSGDFHHSIELDADGNLWVPSLGKGYFKNSFLEKNISDNYITKISPNGRVLFKESFSKILIENGLRGQLLGKFGDAFQEDPIHMNDITPALKDGKYWKRGDLFISARNMSTIFLYRPSISKIIWYQTGPWLNQHDVNIVDDQTISIFGDDVISSSPEPFLNSDDTNQVYIYNFQNNQSKMPFESIMQKSHIKTITEGRARILSPDKVYVE